MNPQDTEGLEEETVSMWSVAEDVLIGAMAAALLRAAAQPNVRSAAAGEWSRTVQPQVRVTSAQLVEATPRMVETATMSAATIGQASARREIAALPARRSLTRGVTSTAVRAASARQATTAVMTTAARRLPTTARTTWQQIINDAVNKTVVGDLTIQQAMQQAMDDAARQGMGFYRDAAGRKWGLDTYSEMAIRTGMNRALIDVHTAELVEAGFDLVIVSAHANPAPVCAPYERTVLSLTGEHPAGTHTIDGHRVTVKDTLNSARANGYQHPNCRHTLTAYLPGFTNDTPPTPDPDHEGYKATQQQRYYEREIRRSRRMEAAATAPDTKAKAIAHRKGYEAKLAAHAREWDLPRRQHREHV